MGPLAEKPRRVSLLPLPILIAVLFAIAFAVLAYERGASIFRVHDVREHVQALTAARALEEVA